MYETRKAPRVPLKDFKRTKIIATVGPAVNSYKAILELIENGANGLRLNFSHGTQEERPEQIAWIRKASQALGKPVAVIQDLQGPKVRLGDFEGVIPVREGQSFGLKYKADYERSGLIPTQYDLSKKVKRGQPILIYDGKVRMTVTSVSDGIVHTRADNDGVLLQRKGINLPETDFGGDVITEKDRSDIAFGTTADIDYVAQSFIQSADDVRHLKRILAGLGSAAKVIAKIETKAAIDNIEEIIQEADAVMVARGDLAIETMPEAVPIEQRNIISLGRHYAKPVIVATQMLATMTESSEPTRAEVSDVATAVILGADCVMLSEETASGRYPQVAVKTMKRVVRYAEANNPLTVVFHREREAVATRQVAVCRAVIELASSIRATAIVAETKSGATAVNIAALRPDIPVIAVTSDARAAQQLSLVYGVKSYIRPDDRLAAQKLTNWLQNKKVLARGDIIVSASGKHPGVVGTTDTIKVRVLE